MLSPSAFVRITFLVLFTGLLPVATAAESADFASLEATGKSLPETVNRQYRLLIPPTQAGPAPLVVYLHGAGAKGDDNQKQLEEPMVRWLASPEVQKIHPCFVLVPQCRAGDDALGRPNNWVKWKNQKGTEPSTWVESEAEVSDQLQGAMSILDEVLSSYPVDKARVYLTGVSMGGSGTWWWAAHQPGRFAAIVTACGLSEAAKAPLLVPLPVRTFHGSEDPVAPVQRTRTMVDALKAAGGNVQFTEFEGAKHSITDRVLKEGNLAEWLFTQRRKNSR